MALQRLVERFAGEVPGTAAELTIFRLGPPDATEKVYLQAALHADEHPGTMLLHHLLPMLAEADREGALRARFSILPLANPVGMANVVFRRHIGRYDLRSGLNYNRQWPDLYDAVAATVGPRLTGDAAANVALVRTAVRDWIDALEPASALQRLRRRVMLEAHDADYVLDLHCDDESLLHVFITPELLPDMQDLSDWMGAAATLTAENSGGGSFDEVWPTLWTRLQAAHPDKPIPQSGRAATLEYRGQADVTDALGQADARNLFGFLQGRGLIAGAPGPRPDPAPAPTPLDATQMLRVTQAGLLAYRVELGARVRKGEPIADLIALEGENAFTGRTPVLAGTDGVVISRLASKYVWPGTSIAKIVGTEPIPGRAGYLLED